MWRTPLCVPVPFQIFLISFFHRLLVLVGYHPCLQHFYSARQRPLDTFEIMIDHLDLVRPFCRPHLCLLFLRVSDFCHPCHLSTHFFLQLPQVLVLISRPILSSENCLAAFLQDCSQQ